MATDPNQTPSPPAYEPPSVRTLVLLSAIGIILAGLGLAQLGSVQEFVRRGLMAERPEPAIRVVDSYIPGGDTIVLRIANQGLAPARIDRAEIRVQRVWKLRHVRTLADGSRPAGGWDVPISAARAPYMVASRVTTVIPPDGTDSLRIVMRPEGSDYFVLLRPRLIGEGGDLQADGPPLIHFFPGSGELPTRIHAEQYERIAAVLDSTDPDIALTRARADAWRENWRRAEEVQALGIRLSPAAVEVIERMAWR